MTNDDAAMFGDKASTKYDGHFAKLAAFKEALHLCMRLVLEPLPDDARVLIVGAGTGAELAALAQAFPSWRFTVVEPAEGMMKLCRQRAGELGVADRCTFHEGYLETLPETVPFDAATAILVSQFLIDAKERTDFFADIAARLAPKGCLVSADLSSGTEATPSANLFEIWRRMMMYTDMPREDAERTLAGFNESVAVLPGEEIESLIVAAGFTQPTLFLQTLFIHGWFAKKAA